MKKLKTTHVCTACNSNVNPVIKQPGLFVLEIIIWILALFIVLQTAGASVLLAIGYSLYRLLGKKMVCTKCGSDKITQK